MNDIFKYTYFHINKSINNDFHFPIKAKNLSENGVKDDVLSHFMKHGCYGCNILGDKSIIVQVVCRVQTIKKLFDALAISKSEN